MNSPIDPTIPQRVLAYLEGRKATTLVDVLLSLDDDLTDDEVWLVKDAMVDAGFVPVADVAFTKVITHGLRMSTVPWDLDHGRARSMRLERDMAAQSQASGVEVDWDKPRAGETIRQFIARPARVMRRAGIDISDHDVAWRWWPTQPKADGGFETMHADSVFLEGGLGWVAPVAGEDLASLEWVPSEAWKAERKLADREPVGVDLCNPGLVFDWYAEIARLPAAEQMAAFENSKTFLGRPLADDQVLRELSDGRRSLVIEGDKLWAVQVWHAAPVATTSVPA